MGDFEVENGDSGAFCATSPGLRESDVIGRPVISDTVIMAAW